MSTAAVARGRASSSLTSFMEKLAAQSVASALSMDGAVQSQQAAQQQMAALLEASNARVRRRASAKATCKATAKKRPAAALARGRTSTAHKEALRVEEQVRQTNRAAILRAMVRLAIPPNRPVIKDILGLSDKEFQRACEGRDFPWEWGLTDEAEFCCLCSEPQLGRSLEEAAECVCLCLGEDAEDMASSGVTSRLEVEHPSTAPPSLRGLRLGPSWDAPPPHRYHRMLKRAAPEREPLDDHMLELCSQQVEWLQDLGPTTATFLEPRRLCQLLTLERDEGRAPAIDLQEMRTVPHETALRAYALHRSQREKVLKLLRRDARAADRPPARAAQHNVAFGRCVPKGDAAYYKTPSVVRLDVKKSLGERANVLRSYMLLRITKQFCEYLEKEHPLAARPESLVLAGMVKPRDAGMLPPAPPQLKTVHRPPLAPSPKS